MFLGAFAILFSLLVAVPQQKAPNKTKDEPLRNSTKVYLKSGASFEGRVRSEDENSIRLEVSFGEVLLNKGEIESINRGPSLSVISEPIATTKVEKPKPKKPVMGFKMPPTLASENTKPLITAESLYANPNDSISSDARIEGILSHYLWFLPETNNSRFLIGAAFFLGFIGLFFFASKLAGIEGLTFGRAMTFCGLVFCLLMVQLHFDSKNLWVTIGYGAIDLLVWCVLVKALLHEPFYRGVAVLAFFVFAAMLGVLGSELSYVIVHQSQQA